MSEYCKVCGIEDDFDKSPLKDGLCEYHQPEPMTREEFDKLLLLALEECEWCNQEPTQAMERLKPHLDALLAATKEEAYLLMCDLWAANSKPLTPAELKRGLEIAKERLCK